ncbi:DegT/DnrJ/EryC1/StrS family aminotransferase [Candidatus Shapirobacteria bacterium]|nr:DegT/DnrJ/EryC1/StrS family aminotransferase [Candidatus Shapirobacteria bacterium]
MNINNVLDKIKLNEVRNNSILHLTANENQMSKTTRMFLDSKINERYFMGGGDQNNIVDFGHFTALGISGVEELVELANNAAKEMLHANGINLNVLSGVHAMMSTILATTEPGDVVMTVPLEYGGHFATKGILDRIGRKHVFADYNFPNLKFDSNKIGQVVKENNVKAIYLDVSYYLNAHNLKEIREAVGSDVIIIYDASHTIGLIMGGQFQSPLEEGANVICANTHKTLPGPHKGMIAFRDTDLAEKANKVIDGCLYSTNQVSHLIALSTAILEMKEFGQDYAKQIISNSNVIAEAFEGLGYDVRRANTGRYSENHQAHVFIDDKGDRLKLYKRLVDNNISTNFESSELADGRIFIRIGTQELTHRGMKEQEMSVIAALMDRAMRGEDVKSEVGEFNKQFTKIVYSFDQE